MLGQILLGLHLQIDAGRAVESRRDRFDLLDDGRAVRREEVERVRLVARGDDRVRELDRAVAALARSPLCTTTVSAPASIGQLLDQRDLAWPCRWGSC